MKRIVYTLVFLLYGIQLFSQRQTPHIEGFFVQPQLNYGASGGGAQFATQAKYNEWVKTMKDIGCSLLIYQFSAQYQDNQQWYVDAYGNPYPADFAWYHPAGQEVINGISIRSWTKPTPWNWDKTGLSPIEMLLNACEMHGVKLWLGLYCNESGNSYNWWRAASFNKVGARELEIADYHIRRTVSMLADLNNQFGDRSGLAGFYIPLEIANNGIQYQENREMYKNIIDQISKAAHAKGKQVSISPFFNPTISTGPPELVYETWNYILKDSPLDIVMLQDGVGLRPELLSPTQSRIDPWFKAVKKACEDNGKLFWANIESYYNRGTPESINSVPTNFDKLRLQIEAESQYADVLVSFSYWSIDPTEESIAPDLNGRKALYTAYKHYYDTEVKGASSGKYEAAKIPVQKAQDVLPLFCTKYGNIEGLEFTAVILNKVLDTNNNEIRKVKGNSFGVDWINGISGVDLKNKKNLHMDIYPTEANVFILDLYDSQSKKIKDVTISGLIPNQWNEIDIPLGEFFEHYTGTINKLVVRTSDASVTSAYFDHLFFSGDPDSTFPPTDIEKVTTEDAIFIHSDKNGFIQITSSENDPLQSVHLYNIQGCSLYKKQDIGSSMHELNITNISQPYVIIQVITKSGMRKGKMINVL